MATGYTADVANGKVTSFPEFAMQCARAFGALITMRDDPSDTPIPESFEPSTSYHETALATARTRFDLLKGMDVSAVALSAASALAAARASHEESEAERRTTKARYEAMLTEVRTWQPPTEEHVGLKDFMVEQLSKSIEWDCRPGTAPDPKGYTPDAWFYREMKAVQWDLDYHAKAIGEEIVRARGRTEWVKALRSSLLARLAA